MFTFNVKVNAVLRDGSIRDDVVVVKADNTTEAGQLAVDKFMYAEPKARIKALRAGRAS